MDLDPLSAPMLIAAISAVLAGTASEAGSSAWQALVGLVRRSFAPGSATDRLVRDEPDGDGLDEDGVDGGGVDALARELAERAAADPAFADALRQWATRAAALPRPGGDVTNQIGGDAVISGNVVQARDIAGPITFG